MTDLRSAALALAERGFKVFPLKPNRKTPLHGDWQAKATSDTSTVHKMWTRKHSALDGTDIEEIADYNIGVSTAGLLVVDADTKGGKDGLGVCSMFGLDDGATFTVATPSGGRHFYFTSVFAVNNSAQKIGDGVDVRGDGGFVVGPGSVLDAAFPENKGSGGPYETVNDVEVQPAPAWLHESVGLRRERAPGERDTGGRNDPKDIARAREWLLEHEPAVEGDAGDNHTFVTAARLREHDLSADVVFELMFDHWNDRCSPPWDYDDLRKKVDNAFNFASNSPANKSIAAVLDGLEPLPPPALYDKDWFLHGQPFDKDTAWMFHDTIPAVGVGILSGPSYSGKTFVALDIARALGGNTPFFGKMPDEVGASIVLAGEGLSGMRKRLAGLKADTPLPIAGRSAVGISDGETFNGVIADLLAKAKAMKSHYGVPLRLVVIDTLSSVGLVEDEVDNSEMARAIAKLSQFAEAMHCAVVIVHHPSANGKSERGATAIFNNADFVLRIERESLEDPIRVLHLAKLKEGNAPRRLGGFTLGVTDLGKDSRGRSVTTCFVEECELPAESAPREPSKWEAWRSLWHYHISASTVVDDFDRKRVQRVAFAKELHAEGMASKDFEACCAYAVQTGMVSEEVDQGTRWLVDAAGTSL